MPVVLLAAVLFAPEAAPAKHPLTKDRTGIRWVMPFGDAKTAATKAQRLIMIKPVAFGTKPNGCW